jgi:hypothetical protein
LTIVRLVENQGTIHIDSSGSFLHRRGYRLAMGKPPCGRRWPVGFYWPMAGIPSLPCLIPSAAPEPLRLGLPSWLEKFLGEPGRNLPSWIGRISILRCGENCWQKPRRFSEPLAENRRL